MERNELLSRPKVLQSWRNLIMGAFTLKVVLVAMPISLMISTELLELKLPTQSTISQT